MLCPLCPDQEMIVVEHDGIELDFCVGCRGIWFDNTELELLLEALGLIQENGFKLEPAEKANEQPRPCPVCRKPMRKMLTGDKPAVLLDGCPEHGLWFDGGELSDVITLILAESSAPNRVISFLGETFSCNKQK